MNDSFLILIALFFASLRMATPLIFGAMGGLMSERSGVGNIALEGFMLVGAWVGAVTAFQFHSAWVGWLFAGIAGIIIATIYALFAIELKADQIVAGTAINLLIIGANPFLTKIFFNSTGSTPAISLEDRFSYEPTLLAIVLILILHFWLKQVRSGLWLSFAGEHPEALASAGISVRKTRWYAVLCSGLLAAWGGASLSTFLASGYSPLMSGGRGFMALAALIFGKWRPLPAFAACLFFGLTDAIQIRLQGVPMFGVEIPVQFVQILPYVVTIVALAGFIGNSRAPKALGKALPVIFVLISSLSISSLLLPATASAWGGRGHHSICSTAVHFVKSPELKEFLKQRPHIMGHLCNVPDIYWKGLGAEVSQNGNPTHYIDPEIIKLKIKEIPSDYSLITKEFTGKPNPLNDGASIRSIPFEFGSLWWRADQFMRRIALLKNDFEKADADLSKKEEQNNDNLYNKSVYDFMVNLGVMGHFVGDASQPLHNSADYDGYLSGHGGLHAYFEETAVSAAGADLEALIYRAGKKQSKAAFLNATTTIEKMRGLSEVSLAALKEVLRLDPIIKNSEVKKERGMEIRTPAKRKSEQVAWQLFRPIIVKQMARSAVLLANLWDEAYVSAGSPKLSRYRSFRYPFTPEFIAPDYIVSDKSEKKDQ